MDLVNLIGRLGSEHSEALCRDWILTAGWTRFMEEGATVEGLVSHYRGPGAD